MYYQTDSLKDLICGSDIFLLMALCIECGFEKYF